MGTKGRRDDELSREELLAELARLRQQSRTAELERLFHELQVHHEEVLLQQSQLIESQRALEEARDRYTELFDFSPIAYVVLDRNGLITEANLCTTRLLERERSRLIGTPFFLYVVPEDRRAVLDHLSRCRAGNPRVESELRVLAKAGPPIPTLTASAPAGPTRDTSAFLLTAIIDLSERRRIEEERSRERDEQERLLRVEQIARASSEAKDRFLAILSHELRTPLTPILFALDALKDRESLPEWIRPTCDLIRRNVLLETRLIDDLLDVTRITQGKMSLQCEVVDLHELISDVVALCREELLAAQTQLSVEPTAATHHVSADPVRLQQVVWNLLRNAVRNTPAGRVVVRSANQRSGWVTLSVSDTGRGIEPHMLPRIFTLFEQDEEMRRRGAGLGLGLAISKGIVEAHGGRIEAASEGTGQGAHFTVELRTVPQPATAVVGRATAPRRSAPARTILLVEDNEDSSTAIAELLRLHGYDVQVAESVEEALQFADQADVLVSDIALPDGTGHDLMRQILARRPMRGIALSGYGSSEDLRRSTDAGFERHLVKPVDPQLLLDAIEDLEPAQRQ